MHRSVKPQILACFGDVCLAIGTDFSKYLQHVMGTLEQAARAQVDKVRMRKWHPLHMAVFQTDYDMVEYLNELREGCLDAYTGIVQGLKGETEGQLSRELLDALDVITDDVTIFLAELQQIHSQVPAILQFVDVVASDDDSSEAVVGAACGIIG